MPHIRQSAVKTQRRADQELASRFHGKSPAKVQRQKQQLMEEARKRYAGDPKTLQRVPQYLEAHAQG